MKIKRKIFVLTGIAGVASLPMCFTVSAKEYNQNLVNTQKIKKIIEDEESIKIDRLNIVNVKTLDENENSLFLIQKNNNDGIYIWVLEKMCGEIILYIFYYFLFRKEKQLSKKITYQK